MNKVLQQLTALWGRLQTAQKATLLLVALGLIGVFGALMYTATIPDYRLLARDLTSAQVAEIAGHLDSSRVSYRVSDGETAILVPSKDLYRLRNELAQRGLMGDGSHGFELLDGGSMWDSTFREHKNYDRAVAGELERSFREIPGVRSARVLIDRPAPSPFVDDAGAKPRASIKLDMNSGAKLSDRQVAGIIQLTSGAISGLPPENVQIMDGNGLLTPKDDESGVGMASTVLEAESERERYLTRKAQEILDATVGRGRSQVKVAVKLDFTRRTEATTNPDKSVVLKEQTTTMEESTPVFPNAGVAGTASNVESADGGTAGTQPAIAKKTTEESRNEYVVGNRTTTQEDEVGRVRAMTVSILVDHRESQVPVLDDKGEKTGAMEAKFDTIPAAELDQLKELVLNAIGFYAAKGSQGNEPPQQVEERFKATVQNIRMWRESADAEPLAAASSLDLETIRSWTGYVAAVVAALVFMVLARGQLKRSHQAWAAAEERARIDRETNAQAQGKNEDPRDRRVVLRDELARRIQEDPALAASIMRKWIHGDA